MGKQNGSPRYNVLSVRVTDEERALVEDIAKKRGQNISALLLDLLVEAGGQNQTLRSAREAVSLRC